MSRLEVGVELDVKVDVVVDNVFAEEAEESAGAVNAAELGAVEIEHALCREALAIGSGDEDGELDLASDAAQGELAEQEVIRRAVSAGGKRCDAFRDEFGHRMMRDIEEVVAVQMRDEHLVHRGEVLSQMPTNSRPP